MSEFIVGKIQQLIDGKPDRRIADLQRQLAEAKALLAEQESIVLSVGPITCRNGRKHDRIDGCVYCQLAEAKSLLKDQMDQVHDMSKELEAMRPVVESAIGWLKTTPNCTTKLCDALKVYMERKQT